MRAAADVFASRGAGAPLAAVADAAGVSIATLYRHFPDRTALVGEVYRREIAQLGDVGDLLATGTAADAMTTWTTRFVGFARTKHALGDILTGSPAGKPSARTEVVAALEAILAAGAVDGSLRTDLSPDDVLALFAGLWQLPDGPDWAPRAERLASFVLDGLGTHPRGR